MKLFRSKISYDGNNFYYTESSLRDNIDCIELKGNKEEWINAVLTVNEDSELKISHLRKMKKADLIEKYSYTLV